jgi:hypothetical protein
MSSIDCRQTVGRENTKAGEELQVSEGGCHGDRKRYKEE